MRKPAGYWTRERVNEHFYDKINELRKIPRLNELNGGAVNAIKHQKYNSDIKSFWQFLRYHGFECTGPIIWTPEMINALFYDKLNELQRIPLGREMGKAYDAINHGAILGIKNLNQFLGYHGFDGKSWQNSKDRIAAIKNFVERSGNKPKLITGEMLKKGGFGGLLTSYYHGSAYLALKEAGLVDFEPWEMKSGIPHGYFDDKSERIRATKWLVGKTGKQPIRIIQQDFEDHCLGRLLARYYELSPYQALKEAGLVDFEPCNIETALNGFFLARDDKSSQCPILKSVGFTKFDPCDIKSFPRGYFDDKSARINAVKWLVGKTGKRPKEITLKDFNAFKLGSILNKCNGHPYFALQEAGLADFEPWEMLSKIPRGYFREKHKRIRAIKWLISRSNKILENITKEEFKRVGLGGFLATHYSNSPYLAFKDAGYSVKRSENSRYNHDGSIKISSWTFDQIVEYLKEHPELESKSTAELNKTKGIGMRFYSGLSSWIKRDCKTPHQIKITKQMILGRKLRNTRSSRTSKSILDDLLR